MVKQTQLKQKNEKHVPRIPYYYKPDGMSLEEWQIALRKQAAYKENFAVKENKNSDEPGCYKVSNFSTRNEYKVIFRGEDSPWNYCSCFDFKTNQLGSCKHLEAVKLWIKEQGKRVQRQRPAYTSMYLSYRGKERKVCLRIGTEHEEEFRQLAKHYFTPEGELMPQAADNIFDFIREALRLDNTFRWYPDALEFLVEQRKHKERSIALTSLTDEALDKLLNTTLYPYQKKGIRFAFQAGKSIIADEMGLGKTIQAIGTAELMKKQRLIGSVLIICPTSLKYQWKKEIERFTSSTALVIEGSHLTRKQLYSNDEAFYKIVSYNSISNDIKILGSIHTDMLIMDEVQRLKNWNTKISKSARRIKSEYAVVLSGTPLENKLEELYSVMQFVDQYALGPYYRFMNETVISSHTGKVIGYKNLNSVGEKLQSFLIRRRKRDVSLQLPARQDKTLFVSMTKEQMEMHEEWQTSVSRLVKKWNHQRFLSESDRKRLLLMLSQMRMVCDSTYILDQKSRYDTKVDEIINILINVFENGDEKVVIFSQWERMTRLVAGELEKMGVKYEYLHGGVPSEKRKQLMENFTEDPNSRVFISTDAGSTGLNLQVASILINIDLPWNPAILEQRIARIYRIGQKRNIQIINMVASNTIEERMLTTLNFKSSLFEGILDNGSDSIFLENSKLDKIMETIGEVVGSIEEKLAKPTPVDDEKGEEVILPFNDTSRSKSDERHQELMLSFDESRELEKYAEDNSPALHQTCPDTNSQTSPHELLQQGISFFNGLAATLKSPEETQKLVDSITKTDEKTGETALHIPIPDKESIVNVLNVIEKLFGGK